MWMETCPRRKARPRRSGQLFTISSGALPGQTELFRFGRNGLRTIRDARLSSAWISWPAILWRSPSSKVNFQDCMSPGSTTRSNSPTGTMSLPASSRLLKSMTTQPQKRSAVAGQLRGCKARICIQRSVRQRLRAQFFPCRVNLLHAVSYGRPLAHRELTRSGVFGALTQILPESGGIPVRSIPVLPVHQA